MDEPTGNNMEKIFLDEMYGDLSLKNCDSPVVNEDSVDIYWGLDQSPVNSKNAEIVSTPILCQKLKDSMDLYEELITEEQQHKESTHNELKSKLDTAENNVKELIWRLQHAETQNEKLLNENMQLKKNISALIKTAKMEIGRKNEEINRLNHRSGRFGSGPPFPRSQINLQRREFTRLNPAGTCDLAGSVQTQEHRVSSAQKDLPQPSQKDRNVPVHRPNVEAADAPLSNSSVHDKARGVGTAIEASSKRANFVHVNKSRDSRILRPAGREGEAPSERQCTRNDDRLQVSTVTQGLAFQERTSGKCESTEKRDPHNRDDSSVSSECKVKDRGGLNSERREAGQDHVKPNKGSHPLTTDFSRKSEKVHSPPRQKRPTPEALHHRPSNSHASKGRHKDSGDAEAKSIRERRRNHDQNGLDRSTAESSGKERKQHSSSQSGVEERSSSSSRRRGQRSPPRDHRQREDKSSGNEGGGSRQERSSRMEKSKDHERKRRKESEKGQRDSSRKKDECKKEAESGSHESLRNDKQAESPPASDNQLFGSTPLEKSPISSTEPESDVKNSAPEHSLSKDHTLELSGVSRTFTTHVVPEPEVSSSFPSPKNCSEPNSTWNEDQDPVPSSSTSFHDEDSMMLTLKSIQFFPNVISPLTSPVRPVKNQALSSGKAPHVKSLSTEFSSVTVTFSTSTRKMDVNKENEKPDYSSVKLPQKDQTPPAASSLSSSSTTEDENELEEGAIVSDNEDGSPVPASPPQNKASSVMASSNQSSPKSARLAEKDARKAPEVSAGVSGVGGKAMQSKSKKMSLPNKKPFKTFVPLLPKTNPSTIPEVMDMFTQIHTHTRNKYMELHKTFPKKYFYNIIDMSRVSFTDFVNNVNFSKLCSTEHNLKPKLNNIISVCMNKISNNGIVKRIFEQQSPSLKKKLWNFVEGQFDFLFKEIKATLLSQCRPADVKHSSMIKCNFKNTKKNLVPLLKKLPDSIVKSSVTPMPRRKLEHKTSEPPGKKTLLPPVIPHCTGLGSRGKNLRMTVSEEDKVPERKKQDLQLVHHSAFTPSNNANSPEKPPALVRRLSHSASLQDKSDYDILTEQQTSSLTFNLVTDSQMGEIFECLLQDGLDLMENSVSAADSNNWSVSTPRKDGTCGESFAGIPPDEAATPSKLITAWSDISPCKFSPNSKIHIPLNPAVLDESCMLEVPPSFAFDRVTPSSTVISERAYSILTEDLAVSLTIPSPLKSDGHLSFLSSVNRGPASAPDSVISARLSEDALLDGEDATEQDIHLALDSDNTSVESSGEGVSQEAITSPVFQIKPHVPMQAVVMEKSNDHFIVRIRHASTAFVSSTIHNPVDLDKPDKPQSVFSGERKGAMDAVLSASELVSVGEESPTLACQDRNVTCDDGGACSSRDAAREPAGCETESLVAHDEPAVENDESVLIKSHGKAGKRKKHHPELKAKKARTDEAQGGKQRQKKSRNMNKEMRSPKEKRSGSVSIPLSPNSLSARNVVRKRGEVVVTWSREEDRDILIELMTKGASQETFSALSTKINKSPTQIEERFSQLMKLFKEKEKMKS
nr:CASP8-associated protein 2 isoform X5 [Paramormyrops kingsleyae]